MKPISDKNIEIMEEVALEGAAQIKAFFKYAGENPIYYQKAKMGAAAIGAYSRLRASETNRIGIELAAERLGLGPEPPVRKLVAAK